MKLINIIIFSASFLMTFKAVAETVPLPQKRPIIERTHTSEFDTQVKVQIPLPTRNPNKTKLGDVELTVWENEKILAAQSECDKIFKKIKLIYAPLPPIRKGRCGTPAPIELKAVGENPSVIVHPAPKINCRIAAALHKWLDEKVQPIAKTILNTSIVKIRNLSSYSCRTRYSNPFKRISEHAFANALDIAGFTTSDGKYISILKDWGETERDLLKNAKLDLRKAKAQKIKDLAINVKYPSAKLEKVKSKQVVPSIPLPVNRRDYIDKVKYADFLRQIHSEACGIFGTVLGPESNEAHRNHFHFDLAKRRYKAFCE